MRQPHAHGVHCVVRKTSWRTVGLSFNLGLGEFPKTDPDPSTGSAWPGSPVRLPCSCDSSTHKRCGPCTKYTVGLTVRLDGPTALLVLPDIDTGSHITPDISSHFYSHIVTVSLEKKISGPKGGFQTPWTPPLDSLLRTNIKVGSDANTCPPPPKKKGLAPDIFSNSAGN